MISRMSASQTEPGRPDARPDDVVSRAIAELGAGRMVIVMDDESRENEGDLVMAAEHVDAAAVNGWTVVSMKDDWVEIFPTSIGRAIK